jgi:hypothetical protein
VEGCCEHGNEPWGSLKCWEVLERRLGWPGFAAYWRQAVSARVRIGDVQPRLELEASDCRSGALWPHEAGPL